MSSFIATTAHWGIDIMEDQTYFGRLVIVLLSPKQALPDLSREEQSDFFSLIGKLEKFFKETYSATMFNYSCLMNNAYRDGETPRVHFHFRPRYKEPVQISGHAFADPNFGEHYLSPSLHQCEKRVLPEDVKRELVGKIKGLLS